MKKFLTTLFVTGAFTAGAQTGAYNEQALAYIRQYKTWAIEEQQRTGVPAAITLAQGIHETQAGTSELATEANNHFGIKCKKSWTGETFAHTDDAENECFRKYTKAYDSYRDHSDYLRQSPRYAHCFEQDVTDYTAWARELKAAGYATNPKYAQRLVRVIEDFHLQEYTYAAMKAPQPQGENIIPDAKVPVVKSEPKSKWSEVVPEQDAAIAKEEKREEEVITQELPIAPAEKEYTEPTPVYGKPVLRNDLKGFYAYKGDVLLEPAIKYNMRYAKLLELNDLPDAPLEADMFVYTERKRAIGLRPKHTVQKGETMLQIAQAEGIQLKQLRMLNGLNDHDEPATGTSLSLQAMNADRPELAARIRPATTGSAPRREPEMIATERRTDVPVKMQEIEETEDAPEETPAPVVQERPTPVVKETIQNGRRNIPVVAEEKIEMPVSKSAPTPRPQPAPPRQKTYTIADEMAVGEENPKYSPRYRAQETVATANTPAVAADIPVQEEPQDDFSRLKARLDKSVYASPKSAEQRPLVQTAQPVNRRGEEATPKSSPVVASTSGPTYHTVKQGETAFGIAKQNNITMKQLMDWNNLNFEAIKVGQKLRVRQ